MCVCVYVFCLLEEVKKCVNSEQVCESPRKDEIYKVTSAATFPLFGCFARRPKSRFKDPYSTLCFLPFVHMFHFICKLQVSGSKSRNSTRGKMNDDSWTKKTVSLRSLTLDHVLFKHRCVSLPTFKAGKVLLPSLYCFSKRRRK